MLMIMAFLQLKMSKKDKDKAESADGGVFFKKYRCITTRFQNF